MERTTIESGRTTITAVDQKVRQPGGTRAIGSGEDFEDASDEEDNLAVGPVHQMISKIAKIQKGIKRPATPKNPDIKKSPPSSKKGQVFLLNRIQRKALITQETVKKVQC